MATTYYPPLWLVLPLDKLPVEFAVLKDFLSDATDDIRYRNLATDRTASGDYGSYALDIVLLQPLGLEIPGTGGLALLVNPAGDGTSITAIPVECQYSWPVVRFVRDFSLESFSGGARSLFDLVVAFMGVTKEQLLAEVIAVFIADPDPIAKFVTDFNAKYSPQVLLSTQVPQGEDVFGFVTKQIAEAQESFDLLEIIFNDYIAPGFDLDAAINRLRALARRWLGEITVDDVRTLLVPSARVGLPSLTVGLRFPRAVLREVDLDGKPLPDPNEPMADKPTLVIVDVASLEYSTAGGLEFDLTDGLTIDLPPSEILKSGIILKAKGLKVDFSRTTNIPEATADGRPADFVGVYIDSAEIVLPKKWFKEASPDSKAKIIGKSVIVGTGGFSGTIGLDSAGVFKTKLGGFEAELQKFSLRFERNSIIESDITGTMVIKGFKNKDDVDATIKIRAHIGQDGDFSVTASEPQGVLIKIPDILELNVRSLGFGREDDRFFVETSGTLTLTLLKKVHGLRLDKDISAEVKKLIIWEDGQIEIQGGTIILPEAISLQIGPVKLSVTALSMGSYARNGHKYKYFGFDGGVNVNPGGVDVRASGVKVYWRTDAPGSPPSIEDLDIFVRVEGIAIDLIIPGGKSAEEATVLISGFLQVKESDGSDGSTAATEYAGGVSFKLPKAGIGGSAAMRLNPSIPAFIIDTELSISVPIPLGNTSLGIYGFRGLIGMRYVADRKYIGLAEDAEWYQYYKKKLPPTNKEGINIAKFEPRKGFAIGAGGDPGRAGRSFPERSSILRFYRDHETVSRSGFRRYLQVARRLGGHSRFPGVDRDGLLFQRRNGMVHQCRPKSADEQEDHSSNPVAVQWLVLPDVVRQGDSGGCGSELGIQQELRSHCCRSLCLLGCSWADQLQAEADWRGYQSGRLCIGTSIQVQTRREYRGRFGCGGPETVHCDWVCKGHDRSTPAVPKTWWDFKSRLHLELRFHLAKSGASGV